MIFPKLYLSRNSSENYFHMVYCGLFWHQNLGIYSTLKLLFPGTFQIIWFLLSYTGGFCQEIFMKMYGSTDALVTEYFEGTFTYFHLSKWFWICKLKCSSNISSISWMLFVYFLVKIRSLHLFSVFVIIFYVSSLFAAIVWT